MPANGHRRRTASNVRNGAANDGDAQSAGIRPGSRWVWAPLRSVSEMAPSQADRRPSKQTESERFKLRVNDRLASTSVAPIRSRRPASAAYGDRLNSRIENSWTRAAIDRRGLNQHSGRRANDKRGTMNGLPPSCSAIGSVRTPVRDYEGSVLRFGPL